MRTETQTSAGGVIVDAGKVVLTSRRSFRGKLQWGLPKGRVEPGEGTEEAALREAREETGLEVELISPIRTIDYWFVQPARDGRPPLRIHKFVHYFLMRATGGDPTAHDSETEEVALLEPDAALKTIAFDSERQVVVDALAQVGPDTRAW